VVVASVRVVNEKERERRAPKARESRRRGGGRGAEGAEGVECGEGCPGQGAGEGAVPPPQNFFLILALNMVSFGAFWMAFFTVQLPVLHAKPEFNRYMRIKAEMVSR